MKRLNSEDLEAAIRVNSTAIARELSEKLNISHMKVLCELKKIGKFSVARKWVLHDLSLENHQQHVYCCESLLT